MARSSSLPAVLFLLVVLGILAVGGYLFFQDMDPPELTLSPTVEKISSGQPLLVTATDEKSGIKSISVYVRKGGHGKTIFQQEFDGSATTQTVTFNLKEAGFNEGAFDLEVQAADGSFAGFGKGNSITKSYALRLDNTPPRFSIKTQPPYVRRGGSCCIVYSITKDVKETGVMVGEHYFPAYRQPNGDYICFFAYPHFMTSQEFQPQLKAVDLAENTARARVPVYKVNRNFRRDTVDIGDRFLNTKMPEFESLVPGDMSPAERFAIVTRDLRAANAAALLEIGRQSAPSMLWNASFLRQPGATRANFADHRIYTYKKEKLNVESTHLGLDIASTVHSPVGVAASGKVVFAGPLGIYGNLVVVDHGLGLQTLYSHLSDIQVQPGQDLARGDILGLTGETGIAFGDHLHFGITISGMEVEPIEWLDANWIRDNITARLTAAGAEAPDLPAPRPPAASARSGARRR